MEAAIEAGADDVESDADTHTIYTPFETTSEVAEALTATLGEPQTVNIVWRPKSTVPVSGDAAATLMKLMDALDDDDDVQNVYANFDISDEEMAKLAS
jgi:transcriptional/translational regulatory protein YebC/TACO1